MQLSSHSHGITDSLELYSSYGWCILHFYRFTSTPSCSNVHRRHWRYGVYLFLIVQTLQLHILHPLTSHHLPYQVLSIFSLAAACASAGVIDLLLHINGTYCPPKFCVRYQVSSAMAFLSWFLSAASSLFNLWTVASRRFD